MTFRPHTRTKTSLSLTALFNCLQAVGSAGSLRPRKQAQQQRPVVEITEKAIPVDFRPALIFTVLGLRTFYSYVLLVPTMLIVSIIVYAVNRNLEIGWI